MRRQNPKQLPRLKTRARVPGYTLSSFKWSLLVADSMRITNQRLFSLPKEGQQRKAMETIVITYNFFKVPDWDKYTGTICAMMEVVRTKELENEFSVTRISRHSAGESPTALVSLFRGTCSLTYVLDGQTKSVRGVGWCWGVVQHEKIMFCDTKKYYCGICFERYAFIL